MTESMIRDINLAPAGQLKIEWVQQHMPVLNFLKEEMSQTLPFANQRIALCLHLEAKTANLALTLQAAGAQVTVVASNPLSTQDDVVAALVQAGIFAFAWHGATDAEYNEHLEHALDQHPQLIIDDGADLLSLLHSSRRQQLPEVIGGCEETTTGLIRLRSMAKAGELRLPVVAVNDALCKHLFDNRYGTGQSVWDAINHTTNLVVAGKHVVIVGFGWCGKGVAMRAKGLGARVTVCEVDPIRANEALMEGYQVTTLRTAAASGDIFVTVTGNRDAIQQEHLEMMRDGAILANAGHFDVEIAKPALLKLSQSHRLVRNNIEEYQLTNGRRVYLLAEGRLVNLAAGNGHPAEIMDLSFALQALSLLYILEQGHQLPPGVHAVSPDLDRRVAELRLAALGITIDTLSPEQVTYLQSW